MARIELSNIGGGGTTLSLTTTGTSGAATLAGSVLNIPVYQGQLTLTTTGTSGAATLSGDVLNIPQYSGGGTPAGSTGQIQYNNAGAFGASANLSWDNSNVRLNINAPASPTGKLNVRGGGTTSSTVNLRLTDSGNTELFKVLDNGSTNIGADFNWDNTNSRLGIGTSSPTNDISVVKNVDGSARISITNQSTGTNAAADLVLFNSAGAVTFQVTGTGNTVVTPNQARFRSSTGTTNGFTFLTGAAAPISFGTQDAEGMRLASGNRFLVGTTTDDGVSRVQVSGATRTRGTNTSSGTNALLVQNSTPSDIYKIENNGKITYWATNTAAGSTGAQTINRPSGTVNFGIGASSLVVTNSLCTTASLVFATVRTNDATAYIKNVVPAALGGSFTINLGAAATAETSVGFFIIN